MKTLVIKNQEYIQHYMPYIEHLDKVKSLYDSDDCQQLGKYLFFSNSQKVLEEIGYFVCSVLELSSFWITIHPNAKGTYMMKIYDFKDRYSHEIPSLIHNTGLGYKVQYRYWKTEKASRNNIYSKEYLRNKVYNI